MRYETELTDILPDGTCFDFWEKQAEHDRTLYVDISDPAASDSNDGSEEAPFKSLKRAAQEARPGTIVYIKSGIYRECLTPLMGGTDSGHMITYAAYPGAEVIIRASEEVKNFKRSSGWKLEMVAEFSSGTRSAEAAEDTRRIWKHELEPDMFRGYKPFCAVNIIHDRLFIEYAKTDMTTYLNRRGCVYCDGIPLKQVALYHMLGEEENTYWVEANGQTIHFRLKGDEDPKDHLIEISVREQCIAPREPFISYIKIKGITCEHAANGGPVPQRGAISAFRGHHWIIEDCTVNYSNTVGIDIGNECWHHDRIEGQIIGHSVIRGCEINNSGVCGIAGLFAENMLIEDNLIEGTGWQKMELSWEAGGIKLHNSVNGLIRRNVFRDTFRADHLWLDCGNENTRITSNIFLNGIEQREAIFIECTKDGVNLIDNNVIWNVEGRFDPKAVPAEPGSSGWYKLAENEAVNGYGIYCEGTDRLIIAHNLIGKCRHSGYYAKPVGFRMGGMERGGTSRKAKIMNNIFYDCGEAAIVFPTPDNESEGNLYLCLKGGYLRIMYPAPEVCLDLKTWQEFYGMDKMGDYAWFGFELDPEEGTLDLKIRGDEPVNAPGPDKKFKLKRDPGEINKVSAPESVNCCMDGNPRSGESLPGPFASWNEKIRFSEFTRAYKIKV